MFHNHRMHPLNSLTAVSVLALSTAASAQGISPGLNLFNPNFDSNTYLVDSNGQTVHTWAFPQLPGNAVYLEPDGTLLRSKQVPGPLTFGGFGGGVQRAAFDGTLLWDFTVSNSQFIQHHDTISLPNGNVLMIVWERMTLADAVAAGRNPATVGGSAWIPDALIEFRQTGLTTGEEVWRWRAMDHLIQDFDPTRANFGVVADHPERIDINFPGNFLPAGEWIHANSVSYDPVNDQILLNIPFHNEMWILDHSTTTAEAAGSTGGNSGKGGDLLWRWGNPASHDAGGPADQRLFNQHGGKFIAEGPDAGDIIVFNNQVPGPPQHSEVWQIESQADALGNFVTPPPGVPFGPADPTWTYADPNPAALSSGFLSSAQRLPNGNTLVCSGVQAWLFEITDEGQTVWQHTNTQPAGSGAPDWVFRAERFEHYLWTDVQEMSAAAGGTVGFDLVAGSDHAGEIYLLLGSFSGTTPGIPIDGLVLPLAFPDPYFDVTLTQPNMGVFSNTLGVLDSLGRASASFTAPAGALAGVAGIEIAHAFVTLDPAAASVTLASNAQILRVEP